MISSIKSLLRTSASISCTNSFYSDRPPATSSLVDADQFPFPTNPDSVKKSRHNSCPKHLPNPEASVNDVRYFLFILLTSKLNNCAKHYPEWVLETCLAWKGDGLQFLNCTEERLEDLCPMTAAIGFDSHKHKLGTHIPFPARQANGETIANFVLAKREGENRPHMIQRRLQEERNRASSPWEAPSISMAAHELGAFEMTVPTCHPLSSSRSINLPRAHCATTPSSSMSTRTVRRHVNMFSPILGSLSLSESPATKPESFNHPTISASPVTSPGPKCGALSYPNNEPAKVSTNIQKSNVPGSTLPSFSSTPIAASMSRSLSPFRICTARSGKERHPLQLRPSLVSPEQSANITNREPGVNLFSQYTMPPAYLASSPMTAKNPESLSSAEQPMLAQKQSSRTKESVEKDMRHDSGVDNSSQSSIHCTYPVPRHASPAGTSSSSQNGVSFNTIKYGPYTTYPSPRSDTTRPLPNGIMRTAAANPGWMPSPGFSISKSSTPAPSITSDRRVNFAPSRYTERSSSGRSTMALEAHYRNLEQLREATDARSLHRAPTMKSPRSAGTLLNSQGSMYSPYSTQPQSLRGPAPPFVRQESASTQRTP